MTFVLVIIGCVSGIGFFGYFVCFCGFGFGIFYLADNFSGKETDCTKYVILISSCIFFGFDFFCRFIIVFD